MDAIRIDFTGIDATPREFELLPNGKYVVEVTDYKESTVKSTTSENHGKPTFSWTLEVESTVSGDTEIEGKNGTLKVEGRKLWENMTIVEGSYWRLKQMLAACGFDVEGPIDFDPDAVLNSRMIVKVGRQAASKNKVTGDEYPARNKVVSFHSLDDDE